MIADFLTKPLQGTLFKKFREQVMGHSPIKYPEAYTRTIKEHVEDTAKI